MASKNWVLARIEEIFNASYEDIQNILPRLETLEEEAILVTDTEQITDSTELAGVGNAAQLDLGDVRTKFDISFEVETAGSIPIDVSSDGNDWTEAEIIESASGGESNARSFETSYQYVRVYADSNDFNDADVTEVEIVSRGL